MIKYSNSNNVIKKERR